MGQDQEREQSGETYAEALRLLQRGLDQKGIADLLVNSGVSRVEATKLAQTVWKENLSTRRQNAYILLGFGGVLLFTGVAWLVINGSLLSLAYILILPGLWFAFKGYRDYRNIR